MDKQAYVNYFPLHGCIRTTEDYVFGATEIASAFSQRDVKKSWESLAHDAEEHAILFWGWNFEDAGPIEAMYGGQHDIDSNVKKWVLLYERNEPKSRVISTQIVKRLVRPVFPETACLVL